MSMEIKALKSILAIKGLELPEDVEAENPVSEFIRDQIKERLPDNEILTIAQDLFVDHTNNEPLEILQALQLFNQAIVNFSMKPETRAYIKELNVAIEAVNAASPEEIKRACDRGQFRQELGSLIDRVEEIIPDLPDGGEGREI